MLTSVAFYGGIVIGTYCAAKSFSSFTFPNKLDEFFGNHNELVDVMKITHSKSASSIEDEARLLADTRRKAGLKSRIKDRLHQKRQRYKAGMILGAVLVIGSFVLSYGIH